MDKKRKIEKLEKLMRMLLIRGKNRSSWKESGLEKMLRLSLLMRKLKKEIIYKSQRKWTLEVWSVENRSIYGASNSFLKILRVDDREFYYNFLRMTPEVFDLLLSIVGPSISKQYVVREPISATIRLELTLRYLATGDSQKTLAALFIVSPPSVANIIKETTAVIWHCLRPIVFEPLTQETWEKIAEGFMKEWDFPHCIGAVDSKLVTMQAPPHSGSLLYDHKGHHSIHLQAFSDAYQKFIMVDIGAAGRQSDGGVFQASEIGQKFINNEMNVPSAAPLVSGGPVLPFVLLGDEAFALNELT